MMTSISEFQIGTIKRELVSDKEDGESSLHESYIPMFPDYF